MVEQIRKLCAENKTSIKALEKSLGFGNGTIRRWDATSPSFERISMVADYFKVPVSELIGDETPSPISESELDNALIEALISLTPEETEKALAFIEGLKAARD